VQHSAELPTISLVIAAYREEKVILERLKNASLLDYPSDKLEIIIGVDGNEDLTGDLVRTFNDSAINLIQFPVRRGKASVLNDCIPQAKGEIIVLSDANTMMDRDSLRQLVKHFQNPKVGGVCDKLILTDCLSGKNIDGMYWRYENFLKRCEGKLGTLLGVNGAIYAIRKDLYAPIPSNAIIDDFLIGMRIHLKGFRLHYENAAIAREETASSIDSEFHRRARIGAGGFQSLAWLWPLLNPLKGRVSFAFWSHKVLRWVGPALLIAAMGSNIVLSTSPFYMRVLLIHEMFYLSAVLGLWFLHGNRWQKFARIPAMFVSMNAALLVGFGRFLSGIKSGTWKRTERPIEEIENREPEPVSHVR